MKSRNLFGTRTRGRHARRRATALSSILFMLAVLVPVVALTAGPASATAPSHVTVTFEGCKGDATIANSLVCPNADYTTGNLGKGWNELDLVPHRLTTDLGTQSDATTAYDLRITADYKSGSATGYDVITVPVVNVALSDPSCTITAGAQQTSADQTEIFRAIHITQDKGTTCVFDWVERLALGAHLYPGSSLHSHTQNENGGSSGVGERDISIPVKEIAPQSISKDMTATQGRDTLWNITKGATPASLDFGDTCAIGGGTNFTKSVDIKVTWTNLGTSPSGTIHIVTNVYATNPAHRTITVNVTDVISGSGGVSDSASTPAGGVDVAANTTVKVLTHTTTAPSGTTGLTDTATATYIDKVTGIPVPGTTTATASATVATGTTNFGTVDITDSESIAGTGLDFAVAAPSVGAFTGGYTAGTFTTGPVGWELKGQTTSGSVTFTKTVRLDQPRVTSGTLSDTATVSSGGTTVATASLPVGISSSATASLTVSKKIPFVLGNGESVSFTFNLFADGQGPGGAPLASKTITFGPGDGGTTAKTATFTGLTPNTDYDLYEVVPAGWTDPGKIEVKTAALPTCSATTSLTNNFGPASAQVKKITQPAGDEAGWDFTLTGPAGFSPETQTTTGSGFKGFASSISVEGTYTITEKTTSKAGYDLTAIDSPDGTTDLVAATCSFTVNFPADLDRVFSCTFTNTKRGSIIVKKVTDPSPNTTDSFTYTGDVAGSIKDGGTITVSNLKPGTYTSTEAAKAGFDLTKIECDDHGSATPSSGSTGTRTATFKLDPGEVITCTFTNVQRATVKVVKTLSGAALKAGDPSFTFELRQGATADALVNNAIVPGNPGSLLDTGTATPANGGSFTFTTQLVPGNYQLCELVLPGWSTDLGPNPFNLTINGDNARVCVNFTVAAGETRTFTVDNKPPPGGDARTIGFWKNWTSCDGKGKQAWTLDQTLFKAGSGGISIGDLVLHGGATLTSSSPDCLKAIRILNKSRIDTGAKQAKDPAFNLAAQLLAAKLNIVAGAATCSAANTAIADAQALLDAINFNGITHTTMTSAQKTQANNLAHTLDLYNNNLLC